MSQRDFFPAAGHDLFLPVYDPFVSLMGFDRARQELVSAANVQPGHHILDIGCGTGTLVLKLKQQYPTAQVVGIDPDPKALRRARIKATGTQLDQGFADELPYQANSFDRVFSTFMFHHLEEHEREKMLREVLRVLKVGGSFHLLDFVVNNGFFDRLFQAHARMKDNRDASILELMRRVGLTNAAKVKEGSMLFGLLRTAYYQSTK